MTTAYRNGLWLILAGCALCLTLGLTFQHIANFANVDFRSLYYGSRCLMQHCDPYNEVQLSSIYQREAPDYNTTAANNRSIVTIFDNMPTSFPLIAPFALFSWGTAGLLWMATIVLCYFAAAWATWDLCAPRGPTPSSLRIALLIAIFLATSELLLEVGNVAGIAIGLTVLAVWCFLRQRFLLLGILCFSLALEVKPHVVGLVWLYFLLGGGQYRKRAWQVLLATILLGLPGILWLNAVAPHWIPEMQANLRILAAPGNLSDPSPLVVVPRSHGASLVSLQTVFALFRDQPAFYNTATQLVCAPLLLLWAWITLRARPTFDRTLLGIAAITALSMLPIYHRQHDTRLLLLTFPACAMLWAEGGITAWLALAVQILGVLLTGDIPIQLLAVYDYHLHSTFSTLSDKLLTLMLARPAPLAMLLMGVFYLAVYWRKSRQTGPNAVTE